MCRMVGLSSVLVSAIVVFADLGYQALAINDSELV